MSKKPILFNTEMVKAILNGRKTQTRRVIGNRFRITEFIPFNEEEKQEGYRFSIIDEKTNSKYDTVSLDFFTTYGFSNYKVGDILYVREPAKVVSPPVETCKKLTFKYLADNKTTEIFLDDDFDYSKKWIQKCQGVPNGCIKKMARIFLKVTNVRVERLQDIDTDNCISEGIVKYGGGQIADTGCYGDAEYTIGEMQFDEDEMYPISRIYNDDGEAFADLWNSTAKDGYKWEDNPYVFVYEFERVEND